MRMDRFTPYLGIVAALLLGGFVVAFSGRVTVEQTRAPRIPTSSTLSILPGFTLPPLSLPDLQPPPEQIANTTTTSSTPKTTTTVPKKVVPPETTPIPASVMATPPVSAPVSVQSSLRASLNGSASTLINALVNILCYVPPESGLHSISASGVIIDSQGIILTNAHVAQYFLLTNRGVSCVVRSGNPAADKYDAALIYISPSWIHANVDVLTQAAPRGTGEYDFALLAITKSATSAALPSSFPFVPLATTPPPSGTPVVIASYGAQFLESNQIQSSLFPTLVFGSVKDVFTFATTTIDVLALGGSAVAQEGSSGGGVVDVSGTLMGTITTSTVEGATDTRSLDAITVSYIRAEYASETGSALDLLLAEPTSNAVNDFAPKIPALESIITAQLH